METPLFSVVIPTFNNKTYVCESVASALAQTYKNIEVIIDDNSSSDGTVELLERAFGDDPRLRIMKGQEDLNIPNGWNRAFKHSKGEFFLLLHSDNLLHPTYCERVVGLMQKFEMNVAYSDCNYFEGKTPETLFLEPPKGSVFNLLSAGSRAVAYMFRNQRMIPTSGTTFRRKCFEHRLPYSPEFKWDPDMELMSETVSKYGVIHIPEELAAIRTHKEQARSWRDPDFSRQYKKLLRIEHEFGKSERHHYWIEWAGSNRDLAERLGELGVEPKYFLNYWAKWIWAELSVFAFFFWRALQKSGKILLTFMDWFFHHRPKVPDVDPAKATPKAVSEGA